MSGKTSSIFSVNVRKNETFIEPKEDMPTKVGIVIGELFNVVRSIPSALETINTITETNCIKAMVDSGMSLEDAVKHVRG